MASHVPSAGTRSFDGQSNAITTTRPNDAPPPPPITLSKKVETPSSLYTLDTLSQCFSSFLLMVESIFITFAKDKK